MGAVTQHQATTLGLLTMQGSPDPAPWVTVGNGDWKDSGKWETETTEKETIVDIESFFKLIYK